MREITPIFAALLLLGACDCESSPDIDSGPAVGDDSEVAADEEDADPCDGPDADGDGIPDQFEGAYLDPDGDGLTNFEDTDSDGDGVPDADEAYASGDSCPSLASCDDDGQFNYLDPDSDNDGLDDGEEATLGTDPCSRDTDMNGCPDLAEVAFASECDDLVVIRAGAYEQREVVTLEVPADMSAATGVLSIESIEGRAPFPADAIRISHDSAVGATVGNARFEDITGGALLTSTLQVSGTELPMHTTSVGWLVIRDEDGALVARRGILLEVGAIYWLI